MDLNLDTGAAPSRVTSLSCGRLQMRTGAAPLARHEPTMAGLQSRQQYHGGDEWELTWVYRDCSMAPNLVEGATPLACTLASCVAIEDVGAWSDLPRHVRARLSMQSNGQGHVLADLQMRHIVPFMLQMFSILLPRHCLTLM